MWFVLFFVKPKTAYEMRSRDWSSDGCSSDLGRRGTHLAATAAADRRAGRRADGRWHGTRAADDRRRRDVLLQAGCWTPADFTGRRNAEHAVRDRKSVE